MKATINYSMTNKPDEHLGICYMVDVCGYGRGLFCTADNHEAEEFARRINDYSTLKAELEKTSTQIERLRKRVKKTKDSLVAARLAAHVENGINAEEKGGAE